MNLFRKTIASTFLFAMGSFSQIPSNQASTSVPTTKILAIGRLSAPLSIEQRRSIMPKEVPDTVRLYLSGKIDQWYVRQDGKGVVFLLNVTSVEEANALLEKLPLGQAKLMEFDLMPLGPLNPLRILLSDPSSISPSASPTHPDR